MNLIRIGQPPKPKPPKPPTKVHGNICRVCGGCVCHDCNC